MITLNAAQLRIVEASQNIVYNVPKFGKAIAHTIENLSLLIQHQTNKVQGLPTERIAMKRIEHDTSELIDLLNYNPGYEMDYFDLALLDDLLSRSKKSIDTYQSLHNTTHSQNEFGVLQNRIYLMFSQEMTNVGMEYPISIADGVYNLPGIYGCRKLIRDVEDFSDDSF
jgi:hypothetical protein